MTAQAQLARDDRRQAPDSDASSAIPPTCSRASRTTTVSPARPRYAAQVKPLWPPPTTIASYVTRAALSAPSDATSHGRVASRRAADRAAGMRRRAAQPQVADRRRVARAEHRPAAEQLLEQQLALEDVALGQAESLLDVPAA